MRVLVTSTVGLGHVHPMVPLARAIEGRGHEVRWALPSDGLAPVEEAGLRPVAAGGPGLTNPAEARRRYPEVNALPPAEVPDILFGKLFGAIAAPAILADLLPFALEWKPDLVVADAAEFAGHIVAAELGVPSVTKGFGPVLPERRVAAGGEEVAPLWRSRGLEPRPYGGAYDHLYLDVYPPALATGEAPDHISRRHHLRPVAYDGRMDGDGPLPVPEGPATAPLVYVTMGTVFNDPAPLRPVLEAVRDLDARVLVTVGPRLDPGAVGRQPAHVRVERYVPQTAVLPHCAAVVSHGGSGTVLAALALGLPQLCLPQGADQFLNAAAVAASGAGLALAPGDATAATVADAVGRLLGDRSYGEAAGRVGESIAAMPGPDEVAEVLESLG